MKKTALILWFKEIDSENINLVGQKGVGLAEMREFGLSVPNGFCLTSFVYSQFLKNVGLVPKIKVLLGSLNPRDPRSLRACSGKIKKLILSSKIPHEIAQTIMKKYLQLGGFLKEVSVAIRSSPIDERLNVASFLNIKGEANMTEGVKKCWASLFNPENLLKKRNILEEKMGVLVQRMVQPRVSGVIQPKNKKEVAIKASQKLTDQEIADLTKLAKRIRRYYFFPKKIEFAIEKRKIYILKIQPIT